jgi:SAM-dependent methyltransferase
MCAWWDVPVRSVLDVGAGLGYWRDWYATNHPKVRRLSVDISEHACEKYDHEQRDISKWAPERKFDLVVCHGVLQYPTAKDADAAIKNLAKATRNVLYLEVPTASDLRNVVDKKATDLNVYARSGDWYRKRLEKYFVQAGAGLWVARSSDALLYELERTKK